MGIACFCGSVATELCSMGGIAECGVNVDPKASPHHAVIEKAQEELRQEYDVREERRRELEFLEKGGNPLDFKLGYVASLSVQSTSVTDQITEQNVISEAKGSFAFATSPYWDSVESSGKPGNSSCRDGNTADNLMLLDGDTNNIGGEKTMEHGTKITNMAQPEQFLHNDGHNNAKEGEDSGLFSLGPKSQAYARRRSKSSRENAIIASVMSPPLPPLSSQQKDVSGVIQEEKTEDHGVSSLGDSKPTSPNCKKLLINASLDGNVATEMDSVETAHEGNGSFKNVSTNTDIVCQAMEISPNSVTDNSRLTECGQMAATNAAEFPDPISKEAASRTLCSLPSISNGILRESQDPEKADNSLSVENVVNVLIGGMDYKGASPVDGANLNENESKTDLTCAHATKALDEHPEKNENLVLVKPSETADEGLNKILPVDVDDKKEGDLEVSSKPAVVDESSTSIQPELSSSVLVKDEKEVSNNAVAAQKDTEHLPTLGHDKRNREECSDLGENNNCPNDASVANNVASFTMPSATPTDNMVNPVPLVQNLVHEPNVDVEKSNEDQTIGKKELDNSIVTRKEYEDSVIRKARFIEANIKKSSEWSLCNISLEKKRKSHWDFVLEEMTWMATDFMQERMWKSAAAAHMSHWISSTGRAAFEEANIQRKQKSVARTLASCIMNFWCSVGSLRSGSDVPKPMPVQQSNGLEENTLDEVKAEKQQDDESFGQDKSGCSRLSPIQSYALRLLEYNSKASECLSLAEAPPTPERLNDFGILIVPDQLSEANLFYGVAPGAMRAYRESVEFQFVQNQGSPRAAVKLLPLFESWKQPLAEMQGKAATKDPKWSDPSPGPAQAGATCVLRTGNTALKDDYEITFDSVADVPMETAFAEGEGDVRTYLSSGHYDGGLSSKLSHKKKRPLQKRMNGTRQHESGGDMPYEPFLESKSGNQQFLSNGKRTTNFLSVPTKRIRTAVRQRVVSPFPSGVAGTSQFTSKTDASSGDTNSYQDDQSSLHGGSFNRKNADIESTMDFDRQLFYDGNEVSTKSKKKKKPKQQGYKTPQSVAESCTFTAPGKGAYDPISQVVSVAQYQKDYLKKRSEVHQFDSNGNIVINGQHSAKKPKLTNQLPDISLEALTPIGPIASPVAPQMSNMANPMKIIKITTRGRKSKGLKMVAGHAGPGGPWSSFEDQALVVLVHDMGENWELVSDALNSIVILKCIYRRPNECKERHKLLMAKSSGDGADSADDSGSSQPYPSVLPGIPKGSARQLFQRLQVPFEEETLKSHFEKIIVLGQKLHRNHRKVEIQEFKQINPLHASHVLALSQVCPSNAGAVLTPLDLCDAVPPNADTLSVGYPGSHTNGLALSNNHGSVGPTLPTSNVNSRLPGTQGMVLGGNLPSPSSLNAPSRDAQRYGVPRPASLQGDEQQRIQYNQMFNGRSLQQPGVSVPGVLPSRVDRGVRMMSSSHGMGMMTGLNRGTHGTRPGFPRLGSPGILNVVSSGSMSPNSGQGMQNTVTVHPGAIPGPGNAMLRPRDPMQMLRPGQNSEEPRQMMMPDFQLQVSQGNSQAVHFSGPTFSSAGASSSVQSFPVQQSHPHHIPQQSHMFGNTHLSHIQGTNQTNSPQPGYTMRLAKERQIQQMLPQQQRPLSGPSAVPTVQNGSQMQQQGQGSPSGVIPSQQQLKQQHPAPNSLGSSVLPNQAVTTTSHKQKKQQGQQQSRQNQQQRNQGSQQAKLMKSLGRGNMMHQSPDAQASGINTTCKNQAPDKNVMQQGTGYFSGSRGSLPPGNQPKIYTSQVPQSPVQTPDITSNQQGPVKGSPSQILLASQQSPLHSSSQLATQKQQQRYMNPSQNNMQRLMMQQNCHMNTDGRIEIPPDQVQHNQAMPSASCARSMDSGSPGISSINQRKQESSHDPAAVTSTSQLASSPHDTFVGSDTLLSTSSQMLQRQLSGGVPIHGHGIGGQMQQQQSRQQQQRPIVQGSVYAHPSNSGPG